MRHLTANSLWGVVHSHPHPAGPTPSEADRKGQEAMGVRWVIMHVDAVGAVTPVWVNREHGGSDA